MFVVNVKNNDVAAIEKLEIDQNVTLKRQPPTSGSLQNVAKLQAEREMMGYIVSTPPARRQVNPAGDFPLNPLAVEAVATKKE